MLTNLLYELVSLMARIHDKILMINDSGGYYLTDKQLHFVTMGAVGIIMLLIIYPLFKLLSKNHIFIVASIYVFTVMIVLAFAIEIGQGYTGTGAMDMDDTVAGLVGFTYAYIAFAVIRMIILAIYRAVKRDRD